MNYNKIISFFVLFILKETLSSESIHSVFQYDITKLLDRWFAKLFQVKVDLADEVRDSFGSALLYKLPDVEYNLDHEVKPFGNKFAFRDVTFYRHWQDDYRSSSISQMSYNLIENKISVFMEKMRITLEAELQTSLGTSNLKLFTTLNFLNFTLSAKRKSENNDNTSIEILYDKFFVRNFGQNVDIKWSGEQSSLITKNEQLTEQIKPAMVAMLCENIKQNEKFSRAFDQLFSAISKTKTDIISTIPHIQDPEQKYYYLIPQVPFYRFTLKSIRIHGLPNIESFTVYKIVDIFTHTMAIKNLRGSMILDYGSAKGAPQPLELTFKMDYLTIGTRENRNCAHVEAKYYSVNSAAGPLTDRQAATVIQRIESAILSSILPSKEVWRVCNIKTPIQKLKISDTSDWETIKETYKDWIPFNGE